MRDRRFVNVISLIHCVLKVASAYSFVVVVPYVSLAKKEGISQHEIFITLSIWILGIFIVRYINTCLENYLSVYYNDFRQSENRILLNSIMEISYEHLEKSEYLDAYQKALNALRRNFTGIEGMLRKFYELIVAVINLLISVVICSELDIRFIVIILIFSCLSCTVNLFSTKKKHDIKVAIAPKERYSNIISSMLLNLKYQVGFRRSHARTLMLNQYDEAINECVINENKGAKYELSVLSFSAILTVFQNITLYAVLLIALINGKIGVAEWILYTGVMGVMTGSISMLIKLLSDMRYDSVLVDDYRYFMENLLEKTYQKNDKRIKESLETASIIEMKRVSFQYPNANLPVIIDMDFKIYPGQHVAFVGINGAGKSTIINLISGLYTAQTGHIYLNGINVKNLDYAILSSQISVAYQDSAIFPLTIAENIAMLPQKSINMQKVIEIAKILEIDDFIKALPNGYETYLSKDIDSKGIFLSGGQMQKISIARALYRDTPIIILDEPTSMLDPLAEQNLFIRLNEYTIGKTVIFITHRLTGTQFCEKILLIDRGRIMDHGSHQELMSHKGLYAEMYNRQKYYYERKEACND